MKRRLVGRVSVKLRVRILLNQRGGWICLAPPPCKEYRMGKILPLFQHFESLWPFLRDYWIFGKIWVFLCCWANFHSIKWPNIEQNIMCHILQFDLYILSSELGLNHFKFCFWIQFSSLSCSIPGTSVRSVFASLMRNFTNLARNKR